MSFTAVPPVATVPPYGLAPYTNPQGLTFLNEVEHSGVTIDALEEIRCLDSRLCRLEQEAVRFNCDIIDVSNPCCYEKLRFSDLDIGF